MKEKKLKFIFVQLFAILAFANFSNCVSKCNVPMLRKFTLTGIKYSVYDPMKTCRHVHDKCCNVADEIKLTKLWQQRTAPMLESNIDMSIMYMKKVTFQFDDLAKLDPRLLAVKYVVQRQVPYQEQYCSFQQKSSSIHNQLDALRIYQKSVKNSMRRLVDKVYPEQSQGRNLKQLYTDEISENQETIQDTDLNVMAQNKEYEKGQRVLYSGKNLLSISRVRQMNGVQFDYKESFCNVRQNQFYKDFVVVNKFKADHCMDVLDKAFDFDNLKFRGYLGKVKAGLFRVMRYKANFYCALCDAHQQKFFNIAKKQFIFSENFCENLLIKNEAHIKFMNIVFVEYIDFLLQMMTCYGTNGDSKNLGIVNFLQKYKRRIPMIQRCYQSLTNGDNFFQNCWFLCHSYKVMEISPFFEGDVNLYKTVYMALYSFLRKFTGDLDEDNANDEDGNIDGLLAEPLSAPMTVSDQFALDRKTRKKVLGKTIVAKKLNGFRYFKLKAFFKKNKIRGFKTFVKNYQKMFPKKQAFQKPKTKIQKKYFKQIMRMYYKKVKQIKEDLVKYPHMDPKVLKEFKKIFKKTFLNYDQLENITPEVRPLRKLNGLQERILDTKSDEIAQQAKILKNKIRRLKSIKQRNKRPRRLKEVIKVEGDVKGNQKPEIKTKKDEEKKVPVEPGSQIYEPTLSMFNLSDFYLQYDKDGIDISKFSNMVDFELDATNLISEKLDNGPKIHIDVVNAYLSLRPKQINNFNHMWKDLIIPAGEMSQLTSEYTAKRVEKMKAIEEDDYLKTKKIEGDIKNIQVKIKTKLQKEKDKQELKEYKQRFKDMKLEKKRNEKVVLNHHIDHPKFEKNFGGIKELFLKLFGT